MDRPHYFPFQQLFCSVLLGFLSVCPPFLPAVSVECGELWPLAVLASSPPPSHVVATAEVLQRAKDQTPCISRVSNSVAMESSDDLCLDPKCSRGSSPSLLSVSFDWAAVNEFTNCVSSDSEVVVPGGGVADSAGVVAEIYVEDVGADVGGSAFSPVCPHAPCCGHLGMGGGAHSCGVW